MRSKWTRRGEKFLYRTSPYINIGTASGAMYVARLNTSFNLQDFFKDYLHPTEIERALFLIEFGIDYPTDEDSIKGGKNAN